MTPDDDIRAASDRHRLDPAKDFDAQIRGALRGQPPQAEQDTEQTEAQRPPGRPREQLQAPDGRPAETGSRPVDQLESGAGKREPLTPDAWIRKALGY